MSMETAQRTFEGDGFKVEEYYWNNKPVVYINNHLVDSTFDEAIASIAAGDRVNGGSTYRSWKR